MPALPDETNPDEFWTKITTDCSIIAQFARQAAGDNAVTSKAGTALCLVRSMLQSATVLLGNEVS